MYIFLFRYIIAVLLHYLGSLWPAGDDAFWHKCRPIICLYLRIWVIGIYPSTGLRVVSLSNHLEFGICVLEFPVYPGYIELPVVR